MYAKSMIEYVELRIAARTWSRQFSFIPVAMALVVATLPFTLTRHSVTTEQLPPSQAEPSAASDNPFTGLVQASVATPPKRVGLPLDKQQRAVVAYVTRKYGVSADAVQELVRTAFAAGKQYGIDPLLVVAMVAVESSFNPIAESYAGAKGLMQIIPKYHPEKFEAFGGEQSVFDPRVNIMVGARIVREYLLMASGDVLTALQTYAGALADRDAVYTQRVLNEKDQLDTLAGFSKTERKQRVVMQVEPEQPAKLLIPRPLAADQPGASNISAPVQLHTEPQLNPAVPAVTGAASQPAAKSGEEVAHTPPTQPSQPSPQFQPVAASVNVTLLQPQPAQRF